MVNACFPTCPPCVLLLVFRPFVRCYGSSVNVVAMPTSAGRRLPGILPSKALELPPHSDLRPSPKPLPRRRTRGPAFPGVTAGARPRKDGAASCGRRSGPNTPLLRWKFNEKLPQKAEDVMASEAPPPKFTRVSARKLAAGIWSLWPIDSGGGVCGGGGEGWRARPGFEV